MMYFRILMLLFFSHFFVLTIEAQEIKFVLYAFNPCSNTYEKWFIYGLRGENKTLQPLDSTGIISIPSSGKYTSLLDGDTITYHFQEEKTYSDTFNLETVYECYEPTTALSFSGYCCCDEKCNDYQIDYYTNGNKRIEGFFRDGEAIGKVYFYYPNGNLKLVRVYKKNGSGKRKKEISYDKEGNKLDVFRSPKWYSFLLRLFRK